MSFLLAEPQGMVAAAADIEAIGATLSAASAAAATPTSSLLAAAGDEVSAAIANLFGAFGSEYQDVVTQFEAFHNEFHRTLAAAGSAYAQAESAAAAALGGAFAAPAQAATAAAIPWVPNDISLVMSGTGVPIVTADFLQKANNYIGTTIAQLQGLNTPEELYPLTGVRSMYFNKSVQIGLTTLDAAAYHQIQDLNQSVTVFGVSQSAVISSLELRNLIAAGSPNTADISFTLLGNPMNPNGGLLSRFPGLSLPAIGLDFYGAQPTGSGYPVNTFTLQYDGYADFPKYPINFLADLNAFLGIQTVHGDYPDLNPNALPPGYNLVELPVSPGNNGLDKYYMITYPGLPLLSPIRAIPVIGAPLAALVEPNLTYLVNWGYGDPHYGYNTGYADVATSFEVLPPIPTNFVGDQIALAGQGVNDFTQAVGAMNLPSAASLASLLSAGGGTGGLSLPFSLPGATASPVNTFFDALRSANTNFTTAITSAAADTYAVALPTADIVNTLLTTVPSYNLNLFLDGIQQAVNGDPVGLFNAIGKPIAADVAVGTLAAGFEFIVLTDALGSVIGDLTGA